MHAVAAILFSISAWIPYATQSKGIPDLLSNMSAFTIVSPFVYDITGTSTITDEGGVSKGNWNQVFSAAKADNVSVIPTIVWGNKDQIHSMLSSTSTRVAHISAISSIVTQNNFAGVDIDYEGKYPSDHAIFSQFLSELSTTLHQGGKILACTVEAKDSEYQNITDSPASPAGGCDQVRVMAYDKYFYDFGSGHFSTMTPLSVSVTNAPLSFDKSAIADAEKYIPAGKIILGIPTYGYDFTYSIKNGARIVNWYAAYSYADALAKAKTYGATTHTTAQDEKYFVYTSRGVNHFVVYSDAQTLSDRIALAKSLSLGGVAIFKIDGKEDPNIWKSLP